MALFNRSDCRMADLPKTERNLMIGPSFLAERPLTVLFLDGDNGGRSQIAQAVLHHRAGGQIRVLSAGLEPAEEIAPEALSTLAAARIPADGLAPKSWTSFQGLFQPRIDVVIVLCNSPRYDGAEMAVALPGAPTCVHWPMENPAHVDGEAQRRAAYDHVRRKLERICDSFVTLLHSEAAVESGLDDRLAEVARLTPHEDGPVGQGWVPA
jgi:arsenate reductase (thioredoxin)